jgi:glycolate oxidase iron-sulfur subunit
VLSEKDKQQCARCGSCTVVCPIYRVTGRESLTARGKLHLLGTDLAADPSGNFEDLFAQCLLCGACEDVCPRDLPIRENIIAARARFSPFYGRHGLQKTIARVALARPTLLEGLLKAGEGLKNLYLIPRESGLRIKLGLVEKADTDRPAPTERIYSGAVQDSTGVSYFPGCHARYIQPSIREATMRLARELTGSSAREPEGQICCGMAAWAAGKKEDARQLARQNIEAFSDSTGPILTSCASCSTHLASYANLFADDMQWQERALLFSRRVREFSSFILDKAEEFRFRAPESTRVWYHEPCHLRFDIEKRQAARDILQRIENVEVVEPEGRALCCGQGGLFQLDYPELSDAVFTQAYTSFARLDPDLVVTGCSGCLMQWQSGLAVRRRKAQAVHLAVFLADCLNIDP